MFLSGAKGFEVFIQAQAQAVRAYAVDLILCSEATA